MAKRVTSAQLHIEIEEAIVRRVTQFMLMVEVENVLSIAPVAIDSAEAFGTPSIAIGSISVSPVAIDSVEAFGVPSIGEPAPEAQNIAPVSIPSAETFGIPQVENTWEITVTTLDDFDRPDGPVGPLWPFTVATYHYTAVVKDSKLSIDPSSPVGSNATTATYQYPIIGDAVDGRLQMQIEIDTGVNGNLDHYGIQFSADIDYSGVPHYYLMTVGAAANDPQTYLYFYYGDDGSESQLLYPSTLYSPEIAPGDTLALRREPNGDWYFLHKQFGSTEWLVTFLGNNTTLTPSVGTPFYSSVRLYRTQTTQVSVRKVDIHGKPLPYLRKSGNIASLESLGISVIGLPTQAEDPFSYSNGDLHNANSIWVYQDGAFNVADGKITSNQTTRGAAYWDSGFGSDQYAELLITDLVTGDEIGPAVRVNTEGAKSFYAAACSYDAVGGKAQLVKMVDGVFSNIGETHTFSLPAAVRIDAAGTNVSLSVNGTHVETVTDTDLPGSSPGIYGAGSIGGSKGDSWKGGNKTLVVQIKKTGGIVGAEAFGVPAVDGGLPVSTLYPQPIDSLEAFEQPAVTVGPVELSAVSIESTEAFGVPSITVEGFSQTLSDATAGGSAESFEVPEVVPGTVILYAAGIESQETLTPPEVAVGGVSVSVVSIASAEAFGVAVVSRGPVAVAPLPVAPGEEFGIPTLSLVVRLSPIGSEEQFGAPQISTGLVSLHTDPIDSLESIGLPEVRGRNVLTQTEGIPSEEAFETPALSLRIRVGQSIPSAQAFGKPDVSVNLFVFSINSAETFDIPRIQRAASLSTIVEIELFFSTQTLVDLEHQMDIPVDLEHQTTVPLDIVH